MNSIDNNNPQPSNGGNVVSSAWERYAHSARLLESKEAEFADRLHVRQEQAKVHLERIYADVDYLKSEYQQERAQTKNALGTAKLDLDAAHRSAAEHCAQVNVKYEPGRTTETDVHRVPLVHEAEAARQLDLTFGVGINVRALAWVKPALAACCWILSSLGLGLLFKLLVPRALLANVVGVAISLVLGGLVTLGLVVFLMPAWKSIGSKLGSGRARQEVLKSGLLVTLVTVLVFVALAGLDAFSFLTMNASRAALNPALAMPVGIALLLGCVCSGIYVIGLAFSNFCLGYSESARKSIDGFIDTDKTGKVEAIKRTVPVKAAIDSLGHVKVIEERIRELETHLAKLKEDNDRETKALMSTRPEIPTELLPHEVQELKEMRERMNSDKVKYEAHAQSRA
ncbi:MAG: hypothetical protein JST30_01495 [Armatimonadetes bacterium]|nr:hypothetical protein [Armatimonadota bacterium]